MHSSQGSISLAERIRGFGTTIFSEMTELAIRHDAVNLGQGFPNFPCPDFIKEAAYRAISSDNNQYARSSGLPRLVETLARELSVEFGRELDPYREIVVTSGATEGIFDAAQALVSPGDEVILFEPFYDSYPADTIMCGGRLRYVPLVPGPSGRWEIEFDALDKAFSRTTRLLFLNTPNNPTGKVFTREELEHIAERCIHYNTVVVSDEVYDRMVFDGATHVRIASLPGMWERTITLGSAGKTFSVTGWKIGWSVAPARLSEALQKVHQWVTFAVTTPLQEACAFALAQAAAQGYYSWLIGMYQKKRDFLVEVLSKAGMRPYVPEGTYFIVADFKDLGFPDDLTFCRHLTAEVGVAAIPPSFFYCDSHKGLARYLARFCFCKTDETLQEASRRLRHHMSARGC